MGHIPGQLRLQLERGPPPVGKVEDRKRRQALAKLVDQVESVHATDPGVADDEITDLESASWVADSPS
jgi:hypothetical protein